MSLQAIISLQNADPLLRSYCDDTCRAKDGASKAYANGVQVSPFILASLPALLASHITLPSRPRDRENSAASASTSSTSRSEESSPLQSPSPYAHPEHLIDDNSPKEDAFMLPGPAYPTTTMFGSQNTYTGTTPIKISASHKTQGFLPPNSSLKNELGTPVPQQVDSTLHYGRRPGHTNSVTSPLALFPVNMNAQQDRLRRESHGAGARSSPHGLSPLTKPIRLVSDPLMQPLPKGATHSPLQEPKRQFAYGMHSPLILAANGQRPASTSAVDFSHANGTPGKRASASALDKPEGSSPSRKQKIVAEAQPREVDNSLISRRRSFPAHLMGSLRSQLNAPIKGNKSSTPVQSESDEEGSCALMSSTELQVPATKDNRGRGRSRDRRASPAIREESPDSETNIVNGERDGVITESRRHLGFSTDRSRPGRSPSRRRAGSSDDERNGTRRPSRAGGRDSRSRDRDGERGRAAHPVNGASDHTSTVPLPNQHHLRQGYPARDLSTIVGSLQRTDEEVSPTESTAGRQGLSRSRPTTLRRLTSGAGSIV